ncbi:adenylate kinase domain-containing protein [Phthorimaea operculella]|nr:adenylate kinase domain-containing protein [Phthorimaea operculella]
MTETDATKRPLSMPEKFIPYLDKYRIYRMFKDMLSDLIITLPRDHLKHMKMFLHHHLNSTKDTDRIVMLISPQLKIDAKKLVREIIKDLGFFVITRQFVFDKYEKHDDYVPGCVSPELMATVTKSLVTKEPVAAAGWIMFDHPCTLREARCLQAEGVLPTVTLVLIPTPETAPPVVSNLTAARGFFDQDFEGLKFAYKATLKEVHVDPDDNIDSIAVKCFNAIRAAAGGMQGPGQGFNMVGAPSVYRVLLIGPAGSGRKTQAKMLARHFGLVFLDFGDLYNEAKVRSDEVGKKLRAYGPSAELKAKIVCRRLLEKDCIDHGWILVKYPNSGVEFDHMDKMPTPPNRIIILNADMETCKQRLLGVGVDWCTGKSVSMGSGARVRAHPTRTEEEIDNELEQYLESVAELRAAAGITAVEINTNQDNIDEIQTKLQAAVILAPAFDIIVSGHQLSNVRGD